MAETIPESHVGILTGKNYAHIATLMRDGSPQVTPVWVDYDGRDIIINTAEGRTKVRNLDREPRVALSVIDHENPYRYVQVRGRVRERTQEGAEAHIDALARRYMGVDRYPGHDPAHPRVIYRIEPEHVQTMG